MSRGSVRLGVIAASIAMLGAAASFAANTDVNTLAGTVIGVRLTGTQYEVQDPFDGTWHTSLALDLKKINGDHFDVYVENNTAGPIVVKNTIFPTAERSNPALGAGAQFWIGFGCPADAGAWAFQIGDGAGPNLEATITMTKSCNEVPGTSGIGIVLLSILLVGGGIAVLRLRGQGAAA